MAFKSAFNIFRICKVLQFPTVDKYRSSTYRLELSDYRIQLREPHKVNEIMKCLRCHPKMQIPDTSVKLWYLISSFAWVHFCFVFCKKLGWVLTYVVSCVKRGLNQIGTETSFWLSRTWCTSFSHATILIIAHHDTSFSRGDDTQFFRRYSL